jgi:hypothetical protein
VAVDNLLSPKKARAQFTLALLHTKVSLETMRITTSPLLKPAWHGQSNRPVVRSAAGGPAIECQCEHSESEPNVSPVCAAPAQFPANVFFKFSMGGDADPALCVCVCVCVCVCWGFHRTATTYVYPGAYIFK